jgi:radical SAM superfamily enzyme YgiQ (UPF0313 family)
MGKIIGLTFPQYDKIQSFLEPSILNVLPKGGEWQKKNKVYNDVDYYLCSVYIAGYEEFCTWAQNIDKNKIVVGGYHPTCCPEQFCDYAHKIVTGLCDNIFKTLEQPGQIVKGIFEDNLPQRQLYDYALSKQCVPGLYLADTIASINTGYGCKYNCDFCCSPIISPRIIERDVQKVQAELNTITINPDFFFIKNENFIGQKQWMSYLNIIRSKFEQSKLYFFSTSNELDKEKIQLLKENNTHIICLGLENPSLSYPKNQKLVEICNLLHEYNIYIYLSYIYDPLYSDKNSYYSELEKILKILKPTMITANFLMPFPKTKIWSKYAHLINEKDYKYYNSKEPFIIRNNEINKELKYDLWKFQIDYYTSTIYKDIRNFECGDTLHIRFQELDKQFNKGEHRVYFK